MYLPLLNSISPQKGCSYSRAGTQWAGYMFGRGAMPGGAEEEPGYIGLMSRMLSCIFGGVK